MRQGANQVSFIARLALAVSLVGFSAAARAGQAGYIRVNQVGYEAGGIARAFLVTPRAATGATFQVKTRSGRVERAGGGADGPLGRLRGDAAGARRPERRAL